MQIRNTALNEMEKTCATCKSSRETANPYSEFLRCINLGMRVEKSEKCNLWKSTIEDRDNDR